MEKLVVQESEQLTDHSSNKDREAPAEKQVKISPKKIKQPLICLDIKISLEKTEQLLIFEQDDIDSVTEAFAQANNLPDHKKLKLLGILKKQVAALT